MQTLQYMRKVGTVEHSLPLNQKSEAYRSPREYQRIQKRHWWPIHFRILMLVKSLQRDYFRALTGFAVLCEAVEGTRKRLVMPWSWKGCHWNGSVIYKCRTHDIYERVSVVQGQSNWRVTEDILYSGQKLGSLLFTSLIKTGTFWSGV